MLLIRKMSRRSKANSYLLYVLMLVGCLSFSSGLLAQIDERQMMLLANNCLQCHASAETGAPLIGNAEKWRSISAKGEDKILENVVHGIGGMPPLGYCSACSEDDFRVLIRFIAGLPDQKGH